MKLSPKAHRFVAEAARDLPDEGMRERLRAWIDANQGVDLPPEIANLALEALVHFERWMKGRLDTGHLDEDQRAEIINDLRLVYSIERALERELILEQQRA